MADENIKIGPTYVDGIASTPAIDTSGEIVDLAGIDCSSLLGAVLNWEHKSDIPAQIVGKILEYKKIFSEADCENDRHKFYWDICKNPYLYVLGRLFDDKKDSSKECAALFLDDAEHPDEPPTVSFSIEGSKVDKKGIIVTHSIARKLTITNANANKQCIAKMVPAEPAKPDPDSIFKSEPSFTIELMQKKETLSKSAVPGSAYPPKEAVAPKAPKPASTGMSYGPMPTPQKDPGKEIGKTKSGKSVMSHLKPTDYKNFTSQDHQDAGSLHFSHAEEGKGVPGAAHFNTAKNHMTFAGRTERQESNANLSREQAIKRPDINRDRLKKGMGGALSTMVNGAAYQKENLKKDEVTKKPISEMHPNELVTGKMYDIGLKSGHYAKYHCSTPAAHRFSSENETKHHKVPRVKSLEKGMDAGSAMGSPAALTQGAALGKEGLDKKMKKNWLARAEQEYKSWAKREEFENFMSKAMPHLAKGEIQAIGQTLCLKKSLEAEKKLKKMMKK